MFETHKTEAGNISLLSYRDMTQGSSAARSRRSGYLVGLGDNEAVDVIVVNAIYQNLSNPKADVARFCVGEKPSGCRRNTNQAPLAASTFSIAGN